MLSSNANFDEQGFAAIIRDLERINLLVTGGNPSPASAQDQALQQGDQSVNLPTGSTMNGDTIATLPLDLPATIPTTIPVPLTEGGTGATTASGARTNLGLGGMAVVNSPVPIANGGTNATNTTSARTNLGLGSDATGSNLSSLTNTTTARSNLGLGSDATGSNLSALTNVATARSNMKMFSGTITSYTTGGSSGNFTVPAGVYEIWAAVVGAGGGSCGSNTTGTIIGYMASTSGGSPTVAITIVNGRAGGGAGGMAFVHMKVTPGATIAYSIGSGGSSGADSSTAPGSGSNGGDTTFGGITARGGIGATAAVSASTPATPGNGGQVSGVNGGSNEFDVGVVGHIGMPPSASIGSVPLSKNATSGGTGGYIITNGGASIGYGAVPSSTSAGADGGVVVVY